MKKFGLVCLLVFLFCGFRSYAQSSGFINTQSEAGFLTICVHGLGEDVTGDEVHFYDLGGTFSTFMDDRSEEGSQHNVFSYKTSNQSDNDSTKFIRDIGDFNSGRALDEQGTYKRSFIELAKLEWVYRNSVTLRKNLFEESHKAEYGDKFWQKQIMMVMERCMARRSMICRMRLLLLVCFHTPLTVVLLQ